MLLPRSRPSSYLLYYVPKYRYQADRVAGEPLQPKDDNIFPLVPRNITEQWPEIGAPQTGRIFTPSDDARNSPTTIYCVAAAKFRIRELRESNYNAYEGTPRREKKYLKSRLRAKTVKSKNRLSLIILYRALSIYI